MACDYSQIELRIMAHLSQDPGLVAAFEGGQDIHRATAAEVFAVPLEMVDPNERRAAKAINFGLMYGMGAFGSRASGSRARSAGLHRALFARYRGAPLLEDGAAGRENGFGKPSSVAAAKRRSTAQQQQRPAAGELRSSTMQGTARHTRRDATVHDWLQPHASRAL